MRVRTAFRDSVYVQTFKRQIMRASMAFLVQQILDEPNVPRNFALGHKGTNSLECVCKDSNIQSRILSEGFEEKLESFQKDSKKS